MNSRNPYSFLSCRIKREAGTHTKAEVIVMSKASVYFTLGALEDKHNSKAIKRELDTLPGVRSVSISDSSNRVAVDFDTTSCRRRANAGEQSGKSRQRPAAEEPQSKSAAQQQKNSPWPQYQTIGANPMPKDSQPDPKEVRKKKANGQTPLTRENQNQNRNAKKKSIQNNDV